MQDWPTDPLERIEAKVDKALNNHLPHIEGRVHDIEQLLLEKGRWAFWSGIATLLAVGYLVVR